MIAVVRGRPGQQIFLMGHPDESRQNGFSSKCESNFERKESVEAEIGRKMSLKYFKESPSSTVFCCALSLIVIIGLGTAVIFAIIETQDKPVHNYDGEIDFKAGKVESS